MEGKIKIVHSYSSISTFTQCKKKYLLSKENKTQLKKYEETGIQNGGKFMHLFMELYYLHCKENKTKTDITIFDKLFNKTLLKFEMTLSPEEIVESKKILKKTVENEIVNFENLIDVEKFVTVDRDFKVCNYEDENALFCGVIDRFEDYGDYLLITDYKTGHSKESDLFQLNCYAMLAKTLYPKKEIKIRFHFMRHNYSESFDVTVDDIKEVKKLVLYYDKKIEKSFNENKFPEKSNDWCVYCKFKNNCFVDFTLNNKKIDLIDNELVEKNYFRLDSLVKNQKASVKELFKNNGNVFWKGGYWGKKESDKMIVKDKKELFQVLEALDLNPFDYFNITTTDLKKILYSKKIDQDTKDDIFEGDLIEYKKNFSFEWIKEPKSIYLDYQEQTSKKDENVNSKRELLDELMNELGLIDDEKKNYYAMDCDKAIEELEYIKTDNDIIDIIADDSLVEDNEKKVLDKLGKLGGTVTKVVITDEDQKVVDSVKKGSANISNSITKPQIKALCTIFGKLKIKEEEYKQFIYESFKIDSIKGLTKKSATSFIDVLSNIEKGVEGYELRFDAEGKLKIIRPSKNKEVDKKGDKSTDDFNSFMLKAKTIPNITDSMLFVWEKRYASNAISAIKRLDDKIKSLKIKGE